MTIGKHIGDRSGDIGSRRRSSDAGQKAENDHLGNIKRERAANIENGE